MENPTFIIKDGKKIYLKKFHPLIENYLPKFLLDVYKDYSVKGYLIMFIVSFISVGIAVAIGAEIYKFILGAN